MSAFEDTLWIHLVEEHGADHVRLPDRRRGREPRSARPVLALAGAGLVAVVAAMAILLLSATTSPPTAYALSQNRDGSVTITFNDVSKAIPAVNARFRALGIRETAVPIVAGCTASTFRPQLAGSAPRNRSITVGNQWIPLGERGYIAVAQLRDGEVLIASGTTARPIPSCFPASPSMAF